MPLFECEKCGTVDNTALTNFWIAKMDKTPFLCSECDPELGKWHGQFPKTTRAEYDAKFEKKVEYPARKVPR